MRVLEKLTNHVQVLGQYWHEGKLKQLYVGLLKLYIVLRMYGPIIIYILGLRIFKHFYSCYRKIY